MPLFTFLHHYLFWHYTNGFISLFKIWKNISWFTFHSFGVKQHLRSLFSPWRRITEERHLAWNLEDMGEVLVVNTISRLIGFSLRLILITGSLITSLLELLILFFIIFVWLLAPLLLSGSIILGVILII